MDYMKVKKNSEYINVKIINLKSKHMGILKKKLNDKNGI